MDINDTWYRVLETDHNIAQKSGKIQTTPRVMGVVGAFRGVPMTSAQLAQLFVVSIVTYRPPQPSNWWARQK